MCFTHDVICPSVCTLGAKLAERICLNHIFKLQVRMSCFSLVQITLKYLIKNSKQTTSNLLLFKALLIRKRVFILRYIYSNGEKINATRT